MTELKLGNKYECFNCGAKFYDLAKGSAVCPKCEADQKDAEERAKPLVAQSVKRRRKTELLPDPEPEPEAEAPAPDPEELPAAGDLDDEDLENLEDDDEDEEEEDVEV